MMRPLFAVLVALPGLAAGADRWDRLSTTSPEQRVTVHLFDGSSYKGTIRDVGPNGFTVLRKQGPVQVRLEEVETVTRKSRWRAALWSAAIVGGITGAIGAARAGFILDKNNPTVKDRLGTGLMVGGMFGGVAAGAGFAIGMAHPIYTGPAPPTVAPRR